MNTKRHDRRRAPAHPLPPTAVDHEVAPPIERIHGLGATWYTRGAGYWTIRTLIVFLSFIALLVGGAMTFGFGMGLWQIQAPIVVRAILLAVVFAAIVRSSIKAWSAFIRVQRSGRTSTPISIAEAADGRSFGRVKRRVGWSGAVTGTTAALGSVIAGALLVVSVAFNFGWFIVIFISAFQKYYGDEASARARLQEWCDHHGVPNPIMN